MDTTDDANGLEPSASVMHHAEGMDEELDDVDPTRVEAEKKVEAALVRLNYYGDVDHMIKSLGEVVQEGQKILFLIDAPTSKPRVASRLVADTNKILEPGVGKCHKAVIWPILGRLRTLESFFADPHAVGILICGSPGREGWVGRTPSSARSASWRRQATASISSSR